MNRRTFIASLIGLPAALLAVVKKPVESPVFASFDPAFPKDHVIFWMVSTPNGPPSEIERMWMNNQEQHQWAMQCYSPAYKKALDDIARRNPECFDKLRESFYGTHRTNYRPPR